MCEDIMLKVSGHHLEREPGILKGYSRRSVKKQYYPAIIPEKESFVDGIIYRNIPDSTWNLLDRFEGEMYERHKVTITLANRVLLPAETYVVRPLYEQCLDKTEWDFENFVKNNKANFYVQELE